MEIAGKKVTIVGGKRSGMALARLAVRLGGKPGISEQGGEDCLSPEFKSWALRQHMALEFNGHTREFIEDSDLVVLSPGVRFNAPPVRWAKEKKILVLGEIEFAAQFCARPVIAVTGSNGKTTVATLIQKVLEAAGYKTCLCGNVGFPFSGCVLDLGDTDFVVLEISSFQLESVLDPADFSNIKGFKPHIAVILNFSKNHLDRHKGLGEYLEAKKRIFLNQEGNDFIVLNDNDPRVKGLSSQVKSRVVYFNSASDGPAVVNPNYSAALAVGRILGIDEGSCLQVFREFTGVEHRMEKVRCLDGIDFINDSKATTAEAALWALENIERPVVMICGGRDKNIDFSVLAGPARQKVKKMFVIGEAKGKIRRALNGAVRLEECDGMEEAVARARQSAAAGDCVLLSPMCASFDMFADFEERGRVFKEIVNRLV